MQYNTYYISIHAPANMEDIKQLFLHRFHLRGQLCTQRVPVTILRVWIFKGIKPMLEAFAFGVDAQSDPAYEIVGLANVLVPNLEL